MDSNLRQRAESLCGRRILVLGDVIADEYPLGLTSRVSREAPVLILKHQHRELRRGGLETLPTTYAPWGGSACWVCWERTPWAGRACDLLEEKGIDGSGVLRLPAVETTCKTRVPAGGVNTAMQQVIRIDR
ncbi:MAG: hypothetical protein ACE5JS_02295 [Nitrospinota bacterium]